MKKIIIPIISLLIIAIGSFLGGYFLGYDNFQRSEEYSKFYKEFQDLKSEKSRIQRELDDAQYTIDKTGILPTGAKYVRPQDNLYEPYLSPTLSK